MRAIGARIRKAREERGMTKAELARAIPTTFFTLSRYEKGEIACTTLVLLDICRALGKTPDEILL